MLIIVNLSAYKYGMKLENRVKIGGAISTIVWTSMIKCLNFGCYFGSLKTDFVRQKWVKYSLSFWGKIKIPGGLFKLIIFLLIVSYNNIIAIL